MLHVSKCPRVIYLYVYLLFIYESGVVVSLPILFVFYYSMIFLQINLGRSRAAYDLAIELAEKQSADTREPNR